LGSLDGSTDRELVSSPAQADYASGHLLFARGDTLMSQPFDVDRLVLSGEAMPLVDKIMVLPDAAVAIFSASQSGLLAYQTGEVVLGTRLELRDRQGEILHQIGEPVVFGQMALSPDGKIVAAVHYDSGGLSDLWLTEIDTGLRNRFTFESGANLWMAWHPDGKSLFFSSTSGAGSNLYRKDVGGAGEMEALFESDQTRLPCSVSPDGQSVLIWEVIPGTGSDIWTWSLADGGEPRPFRQTEADERCGSFSPDGRWVAYYSTEVGQRRSQVYVTPFPGPGRRWQISTNGGLYPQWTADGRELVYTEPNGQLVAVEVNPGEDTIHVGQAQPLFRIHPPQPDGPNFALTPDGEHVLLWTNPRDQADTVLNLVVNWPELHARR
jgi:WD40 repeat protein